MEPADPLPMAPGEFKALRDLIRDHAGIRFDDTSAYLLQRRLWPRVQALQLSGFIEYYDYLQDPALGAAERARELQELFERVATRETYFFRESYQLEVLREELLPRLHAEGRPAVALWSAGCSTGEEPYTLAITALESRLFGGEGQVSVLGTDLSEKALEVARAAVYGPSAFRQTDEARRRRYFRALPAAAAGPERWQVVEEARRLVCFERVNLNQLGAEDARGPFDMIFCRNVMIYFDRALRPQLVAGLVERLAPGGYLLLGHSEMLPERQPGVELCQLRGVQLYRRVGGGR